MSGGLVGSVIHLGEVCDTITPGGTHYYEFTKCIEHYPTSTAHDNMMAVTIIIIM